MLCSLSVVTLFCQLVGSRGMYQSFPRAGFHARARILIMLHSRAASGGGSRATHEDLMMAEDRLFLFFAVPQYRALAFKIWANGFGDSAFIIFRTRAFRLKPVQPGLMLRLCTGLGFRIQICGECKVSEYRHLEAFLCRIL